jgi:pteridine reductase
LCAAGGRARAIPADLTNEVEVERLVEELVREFGRLDAVVHCAAVWGRQPLERITAADLRAELDANLVSSFLVAQRTGLVMAGQEAGGGIVLIGDWACERPYPDHAAYFASKGGIPTLVRTFAVELAMRNPRVRVNGILPGPVMLPADLPEAERAEAIAGTLVRREGTPGNVAQAVLALLENDFITGVCLPVDGGRTIYAGGGWTPSAG